VSSEYSPRSIGSSYTCTYLYKWEMSTGTIVSLAQQYQCRCKTYSENTKNKRMPPPRRWAATSKRRPITTLKRQYTRQSWKYDWDTSFITGQCDVYERKSYRRPGSFLCAAELSVWKIYQETSHCSGKPDIPTRGEQLYNSIN